MVCGFHITGRGFVESLSLSGEDNHNSPEKVLYASEHELF